MSDELKELGEQLSESKMKELMQQLNEKAQSGALTQQDISEVLRNLDNASASYTRSALLQDQTDSNAATQNQNTQAQGNTSNQNASQNADGQQGNSSKKLSGNGAKGTQNDGQSGSGSQAGSGKNAGSGNGGSQGKNGNKVGSGWNTGGKNGLERKGASDSAEQVWVPEDNGKDGNLTGSKNGESGNRTKSNNMPAKRGTKQEIGAVSGQYKQKAYSKLKKQKIPQSKEDMALMQVEDIKEYSTKIKRTEEEIAKGIIGQRNVIHHILLAILADGNVLLEGVPGLGKTQLVKTLAKVMDLNFSRIQFTPDLMPTDITGTNLIIKEGDRNRFQFEKGPVFANLVLADEINRATPKTQSALLEAMQEKTVTVGNHTYELPKPYMVLATQNPIENEGTYPLPEAQLDRFLFKLLIEFPSLEELKQIMHLTVEGQQEQIQPMLTAGDLMEMRQVVRDIPVSAAVEEYALALVIGTHPDSEYAVKEVKQYVLEGASPRAAQAILLTAKARALLDGRYNVSFDDIDDVAKAALRHRLALNFDALSENIVADTIIAALQEALNGRKTV